MGAGLIGLYSYQRNSEFREDKVTLLKSLEREKEENDFLQKQIIKASTQTLTGQNTFTQAPIVPNGTLDNF